MSSFAHTYQPLDYSYQNLTDITQLLTSEPHNDSQSELIQQTKRYQQQLKLQQSTQVGQIPAVLRTLNAIRNIQPEKQHTDLQLYKREPVITRGLKLSYNALHSISGIVDTVEQLIYNATVQLKFIDLSFNQLTTIESDILQYSNLTVLYLQGNNISNFTELFKLRKLHHLQKLQLTGNPLYNTEHNGNISKPRAYIIGILQQLKVLDCVTISNEERELSLIYVHSFEKRKIRKLARTAELQDSMIVAE